MIKLKNTYTAVGLMSGTSLDGLDAALCEFSYKNGSWVYAIKEAETFHYNKIWKDKLQAAPGLNAQDFWKLHVDFGKFSGKAVNRFLKGKKYSVDVVASHGHTVFHQPEKGFTCQIGDGATIAALTGHTTACDFRSTDVALGGQGAPLVPIGDSLLFAEYEACLNIGGIANLSFKHKKQRLAFDICPANLVFNFYADKAGMEYDKGGKLASKGRVDQALLKKLNGLPFYKNLKPKSLGREWIAEHILSLSESSTGSLQDKLATLTEHAAFQTAEVLHAFKIKNVLVTGGGAYNTFFLERIRHYTTCRLILPDDKTIQFKEALVFAFLGVLRLRNENNCLKQVTGASKNNCGGALYAG